MGNVTVPESDPTVEICFSLSSGITEQVVVTAETGPKARAANQATGTYILYPIPSIRFCTVLQHGVAIPKLSGITSQVFNAMH